ncbi:MAG: MFS transporter [Blastocatellia bacterium]
MFKDRRFVPIFIVVFVDLLGFSIILPLLPYYAGEFGASPPLIGFLISSYSICQFVAAPILGDLSDRFGRRPVLIYSQLGSLTGFLLMGLAIYLPHPLWWLFLARIIDGLSGGNLTVAQAYISDITRPEERAKYYGMVIGVSFGLGFLIGPMLGGFLSRYGYDVPAYAAAVFSAASMLATIFLLPESQEKQPGERGGLIAYYTRALDYLRIVELRPLLMIFLFMSLPFALYVTMYPFFTKLQLNLSAEQAGYFLGLAGFLGIIWQGGVIGPLVRRIGDHRALVLGLLCSAIGMYLLTFVDVWWKLIGVAIVFSFGHGITRPPLTSILITRAPPERRGGVLGATTSIESFSRIVAPLIGGRIVALSPPAIGWIGGIFFTIAMLIALMLHRQHQADEVRRAVSGG